MDQPAASFDERKIKKAYMNVVEGQIKNILKSQQVLL